MLPALGAWSLFKFYLFLYSCAGSCCALGSSSCSEQGMLFVAVHRVLSAGAASCGAQAVGARV